MDTEPSKHYFRSSQNQEIRGWLTYFKTEFLDIKSTYKHHISIYTDGSKQDQKVPVLLLVQIVRTALNYLTKALLLLKQRLLILHFIIQEINLKKQFIIYSDSLSVLRSLKNLYHRTPLIQQILRKYNYLSAFKEIVFVGFQATLTFVVTNLLI